MQERLWKRAAAKALAEAAAAAVQHGELRASAAGAELRGGAAAAKVGPMACEGRCRWCCCAQGWITCSALLMP